MKINILILSIGRRVELVKCFRNAAKKLGIDTKIIGADCSNTAPALYFTDKIHMLPRISSPEYIDSIIHVCNIENIALIIPTIDTDLLLLSENKSYIEKNSGVIVLISDRSVIEICRNKVNTQKFLEKHKFGVPPLYTKDEIENERIQFPVFIKPQDGSSSINTFKVNNLEELALYRNIVPKPMIQKFIYGDEYTVDTFLDFESNVVSVVPRLRLTVRSGEVLKGKIVKNKEIVLDVIRMMNILKPIGQITIQCIKTEEDIKYIEINPRFGGGTPMSIYSGADSCEYLYRLLLGQRLYYNENYRDNLLFLRFESSICLDENMKQINCMSNNYD